MSKYNFYKITFNKWTGTYYVYRKFQPVVIRKNATPKMKEFMNDYILKKEGAFSIWQERS